MDRRYLVLAAVLAFGMVLAGCTSSSPSKGTVSAAQKTAVENSYDATAALADTVEALDGMVGSTQFGNGTGGSVTVGGHGQTTVTCAWTGSATCGTATVTTKSGSTTESTYAIAYTGSNFYGVMSYTAEVTGKTARGADIDVTITVSKVTGMATSAAVSGNITYGGTVYVVSGGSTTDAVARSASWAYKIEEPKGGITVTIAATYAAGSFSGAMTVQDRRGTTLATATTGGGGTVTIEYKDGTTRTVQVFPDPTQ
ncbi:MAG: hypothetical protein FJ149_04020 [Euryarchaeota archaeon]|nr:hypothetical protein [Euryarchaeota archaeon]